eukprot:CAMPEP_0113291638 /NCGR_PEP_ID=MMETSP0008_2-20120614/34165_1 /TAXON_ID=97485 /ORGANISM="Prymnesium parvum" /LENGTH=564 /DNA_ID=CAMNT_0000143583 /DNA_START=222 /DNA_END=1913 /DNA_ORIENTATION=+ /assembly_acc=CAM_ASM_000153
MRSGEHPRPPVSPRRSPFARPSVLEDLLDKPHHLRPPLAQQDVIPRLEELLVEAQPEEQLGGVARAQELLAVLGGGGAALTLWQMSSMDTDVRPHSYCGAVRLQHLHVDDEAGAEHLLRLGGDEHVPLVHVLLVDPLDAEADVRVARHPLHRHPLAVDRPDGDLHVLVLVGAEPQLVAHADRAAHQVAPQHGADARHRPRRVEVHLHLIRLRRQHALGQQVEEGVQLGDALHRHVGHHEDRDDRLRVDVLRAADDVGGVLDLDRDAAHQRLLQQSHDRREGVLQHVELVLHHVRLGDDNAEWHVEGLAEEHVLDGHLEHAAVAADHDEARVGAAAREAEDRGLEVLLVAGEVEEGDDLRAALHHLRPRVHAFLLVVHHAALRVVPEDLVADGGGPPALDLVRVVEHREPRRAAPVVRLPVGEHREQRALAAVHTPRDRHLHVDVRVLVVLADTHLVDRAAVGQPRLRERVDRVRVHRRRRLEASYRRRVLVVAQPRERAVVLDAESVEALGAALVAPVPHLRREALHPRLSLISQLELILDVPVVALGLDRLERGHVAHQRGVG